MADKITSVVAREDNGNIQITFTLPFSIVKEAQDNVIKEFAKDTEIPGFRKGMAPLEKVAAKIPQNTLIEHALSHVLPKALAEAITNNKLQIAIYPKFELINAKEGETWQIRGVTCELPKVELGDYKKSIQGALRSNSIIVPGKEKKELTREEKENIAIKALLDSIKLKLPQILVDEEVDSRLSSLLGRLEKLGLALESYLSSIGKKVEDLRSEYTNQAKDAISLDLILTKVAEDENINVDQKEIEGALEMSQVDPKAKDMNPEEIDNKKRLMESILKRRKALDFLINLG